MPPRFEFDASEAILRLALRAGEGQNFDKRFAQGQQLVAGVRAQQAQQDALRLQREQLNLQAQLRRTGGTPTAAPARVVRNPFTRSVEEANAEFKSPPQQPQIVTRRGGTPGAGTISGGDTSFSIDEQGNVSGTQAGRDLSPQEIRERSNVFVTGRPPVRESPLRQSKQGFLDSLQNLPDDARQALQFLVDDDTISLKDIAIRANSLKEARASQDLSLRQQISFDRSFIREQVQDIDRSIRDIEDRLFDEFDVNVAGRRPQDIVNELAGKPGRVFGIGGREAQPEAQRLVVELERLRQEKNQLRSREQSTIAQQVQQTQQAAPAAGDLSQTSTDDLLRELLGQ